MGIHLFANFAQATLASGITDTDTTITVSTGDGSLFPNPAFTGDYFTALLQKSDGTYEYVHCTSRSTDDLTVERGKEGTSAKSFSSGDLLMNILTKDGIRTVMNQIWFREDSTPSYVDGSNFTLPGDKTDIYVANRALQLYQDTDANGWVSSSSYDGTADETTVTVQDATVDSGIAGVDYGQEPLSDPKYTTNADTVDSLHGSDLCQRADNLANLADASTARKNLGLETTDLVSELKSLDGQKTELWVRVDNTIDEDLSGSYDLSGITVVVKPGVTVTHNTTTQTINWNYEVADGGQVLVDENIDIYGVARSLGNTAGIVAFDGVDGDEQINFYGGHESGTWQTIGNSLSVTGLTYSNVAWFGTTGDGSTDDRPAIQRAADALVSKGTLKFNENQVYTLKDDADGNAYVEIAGKSITILAHGAIIKMGPTTGYNAFYIHNNGTLGLDFINFYGGDLFGDIDNQNATDHTNDSNGDTITYGTGDFEQDLGNNGLCGINDAYNGLLKDVVIRENISDGVVFKNCKYGVAENVYGVDGASPQPDAYPQTIKFRPSTTDRECLISNCHVELSNIAFSAQDATRYHANTKLMIQNSVSFENYQSAFYNEGASVYIVRGCWLKNTFVPDHRLGKLMGKEYAAITDTYCEGGAVDSGATLVYDTNAFASNCVSVNNLNADYAAFDGFKKIDNCIVINSSGLSSSGGISCFRSFGSIANCKADQSGSSLSSGTIAFCTGGNVVGCEFVGNTNLNGLDGSNSKITSCIFSNLKHAVSINSGKTNIANSSFVDLQGCGILSITAQGDNLNVSNCLFQDFGKNTSLANDVRVGIGQNNAGFTTITVNGCSFIRSDDTVDMCYQSIALGGNATIDNEIVTGCIEVAMQNSRFISANNKIETDNIVNGSIEGTV